MEPALGAKLIGLVLCLLLAAVAAAGQASLYHLNRARLRSLSEQGAERAQAILEVLDQPGSSFATLAALPVGPVPQLIGGFVFMLTGFGLGWVNAAGDYSRYLPRRASSDFTGMSPMCPMRKVRSFHCP